MANLDPIIKADYLERRFVESYLPRIQDSYRAAGLFAHEIQGTNFKDCKGLLITLDSLAHTASMSQVIEFIGNVSYTFFEAAEVTYLNMHSDIGFEDIDQTELSEFKIALADLFKYAYIKLQSIFLTFEQVIIKYERINPINAQSPEEAYSKSGMALIDAINPLVNGHYKSLLNL
mgnify:CR=1 FL=1